MGKDEPFSNNNIHFNSRSKNKADVRSMGLNMYLHISPEFGVYSERLLLLLLLLQPHTVIQTHVRERAESYPKFGFPLEGIWQPSETKFPP